MSVSIKKLSDDVFEVTVAKTSTTTHTVTVTDQSLTDLTDDNATKTQLLEFSFNFLLDREPNTSILSSFDINVISKYLTTKMKSDDGAMRNSKLSRTVMYAMTQKRPVSLSIR